MNRILIIEDDAALAWLLQRFLQGKYAVTVRMNSIDAWEWLSGNNECNLIISDINMPDVNGLDLLENIKQSNLYSHIPVIIVSADEYSRQPAMDHGATKFIAKPFDPRELLKSIEEALKIGDEMIA
jgi:DNA-binding NtrC family response regulator